MRVFCLLLVSSAGLLAQNQAGPSIRSVQASVTDTFNQTLADGNSILKTIQGVFYRDTQGRTRMDMGSLVVIKDPVAHVMIALDPNAKRARQYPLPAAVAAAMGTGAVSSPTQQSSAAPSSTQQVDLGTQVMAGWQVKGTKFSSVIPAGAIGNILPIQRTTEVWRSPDLGLIIMSKSTDSLQGQHAQSFTNIIPDIQVDPSEFTIPVGFQIDQVALPATSVPK